MQYYTKRKDVFSSANNCMDFLISEYYFTGQNMTISFAASLPLSKAENGHEKVVK